MSISVSHRSSGVVAGSTNETAILVGVEQQQQRVADDPLAALVDLVDRVAVQPDAEPADVGRVPRVVGHLAARRVEPRDVLDVGAADAAALEELAAAQHRVLLPDPDHAARELEEVAVGAATDPSCVQLISLSWQ